MDYLFNHFGFSPFLLTPSEVSSKYPDYSDIKKIGVDKIYFSGNRPSVFVLKVDSFNDNALKRIAQIHRNAWNYRKVLLLYVSSDTEVRIYNCYHKPSFSPNIKNALEPLEIDRCTNDDTSKIETILYIFSRENVDCGTLWREINSKRKIDFQQRVDAYLIQSLKKAKEILSKSLNDNIINSLLMRSLFVLYLEHRKATTPSLYQSLNPAYHSFFDILNDKNATYKLFERLQFYFNGNITPIVEGEEQAVTPEHLKTIRQCFYDGDFSNNPQLFIYPPLFDFSIIGVELISEIYQIFLGEFRHQKGQYYTPHSLVDLILTDKLPINSTDYNVHILDPACGSGIFLVESYRRLIKRWKLANNQSSIPFDELKRLLLDNIFGIDMDSQAIRVAAFSLYLAIIDELDVTTLWKDTSHRLPYLINDSNDNSSNEKQGRNLWCRNTITEIDPLSFQKINLVIGNPPFGKQELNTHPEIEEYCKKNGFQTEYVVPFLHKAVSFTSGDIAMVIPSKILFNTKECAQTFRYWLFNNNYVEKIYNFSRLRMTPKSFGGRLFPDTSCPISVIYYSKTRPRYESDTLTYIAPKTYITSGLLSGLIIDNSDVKELPRKECTQKDTYLWKAAMWGNRHGYYLLQKNQTHCLKNYFENNGWIYGRGLNNDSSAQRECYSPIINTKYFERYFTNVSTTKHTKGEYRKINNRNIFDPPFVAFKQEQKNGELVCTLFKEQAFFTSSGFALKGGNIQKQKLLTAYINSDVAKFFFFLFSSSWGIERPTINLNELLQLPSPFELCSEESENNICVLFDKIVDAQQKGSFSCFENEIKYYENQIFNEFLHIFSFTQKDIDIIHDTLKFNLDVLEHGPKSIGYQNVLESEFDSYSTCLIKSLSSFLSTSNLQVTPSLYLGNVHDPLNLIVINFGNNQNQTRSKLHDELTRLDQYLLKEKSLGIYVRQNLKIYDENKIYIVKPNQKRFWSKMEAYDDASSIIADILNMETV